MKMEFSTIDYVVFIGYILIIVSLGLWVSREKEGHEKDSKDYFLASKSLPWWAIGASLIAANISAEQFIGMSGSGFAIGLAIATYEWMAALTLLIVAGRVISPLRIRSASAPVSSSGTSSARARPPASTRSSSASPCFPAVRSSTGARGRGGPSAAAPRRRSGRRRSAGGRTG